MNCRELEQMLCPYLDNEFGAADRSEVEAHLATCAECARLVHEESRFRTALRAKAQAGAAEVVASAALRQRISLDLSATQRRDRLRRAVPYAAAAAVLVVATAAFQLLRPPAHRSFLEDAAARYAKNQPVEFRLGQGDQASPREVEDWFGGKVDHRVHVPQLRNVVLNGARISNVKDREAAYIAYETTEGGGVKRVGVFVFPDPQQDLEAPRLADVQVQRARGYNVAVWRDDEVVYNLVTELDEDDIRRMLQQQQGDSLASEPPREPLRLQPAGLQR